MKKLFLCLFITIAGTNSFLNAKSKKLVPSIFAFLYLDKLDKENKKNLVKGGASLAMATISALFYVYVTNRAKIDEIQSNRIAKNKFDDLIKTIFADFIGPIVGLNNSVRLMLGLPILISAFSAQYGIKKIASVVSCMRAQNKK